MRNLEKYDDTKQTPYGKAHSFFQEYCRATAKRLREQAATIAELEEKGARLLVVAETWWEENRGGVSRQYLEAEVERLRVAVAGSMGAKS